MIKAASLLTITDTTSLIWPSILVNAFFAAMVIIVVTVALLRAAFGESAASRGSMALLTIVGSALGFAGFIIAIAAQVLSIYSGKSLLESVAVISGGFCALALLFGLITVGWRELRRDLKKSRGMIYPQ